MTCQGYRTKFRSPPRPVCCRRSFSKSRSTAARSRLSLRRRNSSWIWIEVSPLMRVGSNCTTELREDTGEGMQVLTFSRPPECRRMLSGVVGLESGLARTLGGWPRVQRRRGRRQPGGPKSTAAGEGPSIAAPLSGLVRCPRRRPALVGSTPLLLTPMLTPIQIAAQSLPANCGINYCFNCLISDTLAASGGFWGTPVATAMRSQPTGASACRMPAIGLLVSGLRSSSSMPATKIGVAD
jgi:hypothetical protein